MKIKSVIIAAIVAIVATFSIILGGAMIYAKLNSDVKTSMGLNADVIFRIDDLVCDKGEFAVLLYENKRQYDELYGTAMWDGTVVDISAEDFLKQETLNQLAIYKCVRLLAQDKKVYLSENQKDEARDKAKLYMDGFSDSDIKELGITKEGAVALYEEKILYEKVFDSLTTTVNEEISVDEARVIKIQYIYVGKEEKDASTKIKDINAKVIAGDSFEKLAIESNGDSGYMCQLSRGMTEEVFEAAAFELNSDEISEVVETTKGYYIIKCINDYEKAATENNKQVILNERKNEIFSNIYESYVAKLYYEFNEKTFNNCKVNKDYKVKVKLER